MSEKGVEIKITTSADLAAAERARASLEKTIEVTKAAGGETEGLEQQLKEVKAAIDGENAGLVRQEQALNKAVAATKALGGDTSQLTSKLAAVRQQLGRPAKAGMFERLKGDAGEVLSMIPGFERFGAIAGKIASGPLGMIAAGIAGITVALKGATAAISAWADQQAVWTGVDAALAQSGQLTDQYRERLQALAGELQNVTGIADDQWAGVLKQLTQMGSTPDSIGMDVEAVKNLAGLMGGDLNRAARLIGRAIQGNTEGFRELGIQIDQNLNQTEQLEKLYQEVALRGGGQLEASSKTLNGLWRQTKNVVGDVVEAIGGFIASTGVLQFALNQLIAIMEFWGGVMTRVVPALEELENKNADFARTAADAERAAERQARAIERIKEAALEARDAIDEETRAIEHQHRIEDRREDLQMSIAVERIKQRERRGEITPEQAAEQELQVRSAAETRRFEREEQRLEAERERRQQEIRQIEEAFQSDEQRIGRLQAIQRIAEEAAAAQNAFRTRRDQVVSLLEEEDRLRDEIEGFAARSDPQIMTELVEALRVVERNRARLNETLQGLFEASRTATRRLNLTAPEFVRDDGRPNIRGRGGIEEHIQEHQIRSEARREELEPEVEAARRAIREINRQLEETRTLFPLQRQFQTEQATTSRLETRNRLQEQRDQVQEEIRAARTAIRSGDGASVFQSRGRLTGAEARLAEIESRLAFVNQAMAAGQQTPAPAQTAQPGAAVQPPQAAPLPAAPLLGPPQPTATSQPEPAAQPESRSAPADLAPVARAIEQGDDQTMQNIQRIIDGQSATMRIAQRQAGEIGRIFSDLDRLEQRLMHMERQ